MSRIWYVPWYWRYGEDYERDDGMENTGPSSCQALSHGRPRSVSVRKAFLKVSVLKGSDLPALDPNGGSDPYCVLRLGKQERRTKIIYNTVDPEWEETFVFELNNLPQLSTGHYYNNGGKKMSEWLPLCELYYYLIIDIWDKDRVNKDDFIGRVLIPLATLQEGSTTRWYPVGRTSSGGHAKGRILINITLRPLEDVEPIGNWVADDILRNECWKLPGFQIPVKTGDQIVDFPGQAERVEIMLENALVEVSGHRGLGRILLTEFRLIIQCITSGITSLATNSDLSMWVALNDIQSVEKGDVEKVIQRTEAGRAGVSDVKTIIVRCADFRTIRLTFIKTNPVEGKVERSEAFVEQPLKEMNSVVDFPSESKESVDSAKDSGSSDENEDDEEVSAEESPANGNGFLSRTKSFLQQSGNSNNFTGMVHARCVSRLLRLFYKRLKYLVLNAINYPPSKVYVSQQPSDFHLDGWDVYDMEEEFARQKVPPLWRISKLNGDYGLAHSYPTQIYVPESITDAELKGCAGFRSKGRIPALTWYNAAKGNFIMRCSQPKTGAMGKYSVEDEGLLQAAIDCNASSEKMVIMDARSMLAAGGNRLKGKGTEDVVNRYRSCKLKFLDIANIHSMRDSIDKLQTVCESAVENKWMSQLESTQWLNHIRSVLKGATLLAHYISVKSHSILVHCSDGWDRTPQLTSLAQLLLDPFYRTFDGFKVLIEKDWVSFGHRFRDRLGDPSLGAQRSPVFLQFLDCVWQVIIQYPNAFEFTPKYVTIIAEFVNSGWFGNFLCNSVRERETENMMRTTVSIWSHLDAIRATLLNIAYQPVYEVIIPVCSVRRFQLWADYFLRFDGLNFASAAEAFYFMDDQKDNEELQNVTNTVVWVPDERVKECHDCKQKFTGIRRRHHCRACGQIFCGGCTRHRARLPFLGYMNPERVCDSCFAVASRGLEGSDDEYEVIPASGEDDSNVSCF